MRIWGRVTVDASVSAGATEAIRVAVDAELPPEEWATVADLVQRIDRALDLGDGPSVARLTAELDAIRARVGGAPPAPPAPAAAPRRRGPAVVVVVLLLAVAAVGAALLVGGGDDDGDDEDEFAVPTTEEDEFDETTTTFSDETTEPPPTSVPVVVGPTQDLGTLELDDDGDLAIDLEWASGADLDLVVVEPDGNELTFNESGPSASGGEHSGDTADECGSTGVVRGEFVEWADGGAADGDYEVLVDGFQVDGCGSGAFTLRIETGEDDVEVAGEVATGERAVFAFEAEAAEVVVPPTTEPDAGEAGADDEDDDANPGALIVIALGAAALAGGATWALGRRRLPATTGVATAPAVAAVLARPRLPVPAELRELANHTIHRLEVDPS